MNNTLPRPLDPGEAFFFMSDQVSCMNFVVFAERMGHLDPERLQTALDRVQQENTLLQAQISWTDDQGLRFEPAPGKTIERLCHQTTAEQWRGLIEQQLSSPFAEGSAPLMRCLYLEMATSNQSVLALCFHHSIADGRSGVELLRRVLSLMAMATTAPAVAKTITLPPMADVHPPRFRWAEQPAAAKQLRSTLLNDYRRHGPLAPIDWLAVHAVERTPRFIALRLDASTTQRLISQARNHGTSVHGLLCAAQLLAQLPLQTSQEPGAFFLSCPVDMRPYLEPMVPTAPIGFFTSLISNVFLISPVSDVWALAREVITQTRLQIDRGEGHLLYHLYGLDGTPVPPATMEPFKKKALASLPNTMISNLGAVAAVEADPAVTSIGFALCPMPYQTLFTAASTYQGQLLLNLGFDAARLTPALAQQLAENLQGILQNAADDA